MSQPLPIEALREDFARRVEEAPVVITAPTGSGKSTQVPSWCRQPVLVVEPRRVACRALAARVAELQGTELGAAVGFHVRDHRVEGEATAILFVTPGIALRRFDEVDRFSTVILDELHERTLEVDLLLALLRRRYRGRLVAMSATMQAERVAAYLGGAVLEATGRQHPVEVHYLPTRELLPLARDLPERVAAALERAAPAPGDVLVFLPGKAEISAVGAALAGGPHEVLPLHGGLSLDEQHRIFEPSERRKIVLSTNVAETSLTVEGIGVVIDSGLVRRTRYQKGRGFLTLLPVAFDSAEQRAGRAGRTAPGVCFRLWSEAARLEACTPPEIRREALLPLVLAAAACGARAEQLDFLDPPADYALAAAQQEGQALGALDAEGRITVLGRELFHLPIDAPLGRLLVEARERGTLGDAVDLVAVLAADRPLFRGPPQRYDEADLRSSGCDATAAITALRRGRPEEDRLNRYALQEARSHARRLRRAFGLPPQPPPDKPVDRRALALTALAADPRSAHVCRERRGRISWSNGGTEIELARESAATVAEKPKALVIYETRALGVGQRRQRIVATCASPVPLGWLVQAGLGRERVARVSYKPGELLVRSERIYARKVLEVRDVVPRGALARAAVAQLLLQGELFPEALALTRRRLEEVAFATQLVQSGRLSAADVPAASPVELEAWLLQRLAAVGLERPEDLELLVEQDFIAPPLPEPVRAVLGAEFPRQVSSSGARFEVEYDLPAQQVILRYRQGSRGRPPALESLPRFGGFGIRVDTGRGMVVLRRK